MVSSLHGNTHVNMQRLQRPRHCTSVLGVTCSSNMLMLLFKAKNGVRWHKRKEKKSFMLRWKEGHVAGIIGGFKCLEPTEMQKNNNDNDIYILQVVVLWSYELYILCCYIFKYKIIFNNYRRYVWGVCVGGGVLVNGWSFRPRLYAN